MGTGLWVLGCGLWYSVRIVIKKSETATPRQTFKHKGKDYIEISGEKKRAPEYVDKTVATFADMVKKDLTSLGKYPIIE